MIELLSTVLLSAIPAFVFIYLVSLGHSIAEKSGVLNLAVDGMFFLSTSIAVLVSYNVYASAGFTGVPAAVCGTLVAATVVALIGALMAVILTVFPVNHAAFGLSLMFLGYGLGVMAGYPVRLRVGVIEPFTYPADLTVYLALLSLSVGVSIAAHILTSRTSLGASIRAVGEKPHSVLAMGMSVAKIRVIACLIGFFILGVGASMYSLLWSRMWGPRDYLLGYGWIAFTIALAAGRHPLLLLALSLVFGGILGNRYTIQVLLGIPPDISHMIPYISALVAMLIYSTTRLREVLAPPGALGKVFYKEERTV